MNKIHLTTIIICVIGSIFVLFISPLYFKSILGLSIVFGITATSAIIGLYTECKQQKEKSV